MTKEELRREYLKAWAHWTKLNPFNEDQLDMANAVDDLFSQLAEEKAITKALRSEVSRLEELLDIRTNFQGQEFV